MGTSAETCPIKLNLGCGSDKLDGYINVDAYGEPDFWWDLNIFPYPWPENSVDAIEMSHVLEHLDDWWGALKECARILKPHGFLHIRVPDESSSTALSYRDHHHVFTWHSFHGLLTWSRSATNEWAKTQENTVPLKCVGYHQVPFPKYQWMVKWCPRVLRFCADHFRNFIWEQRFLFVKEVPRE